MAVRAGYSNNSYPTFTQYCQFYYFFPSGAGYLPSDPGGPAQHGVAAVSLTVRLLAARHIMRPGRGLVSPFLELEVIGAEYDCVKHKTKTVPDNGFNPVWDETFQLRILNPDLAMVRFAVFDEDMFGDPNFLGAATYPVRLLLSGYRSVQLRNGHSEELELSALLVQLTRAEGESGTGVAEPNPGPGLPPS